MNDLERDLKDLLETKAGGLDTTPLAPPAVLRRGRRRQVGTVVGGALMAVAAAAVVVGGAAAFLGDRASEPPIMGEADTLPARTATIGGVTVTAPQGWSLLDQSLWSMAIATETCSSSFEGTATPVGPGASEGDADPVETPPAVEEECTPVDLPAGVPLFTLANVEPNPLQTVCEVTPELGVQRIGPTDAYLYVALDPNPADPGASWPAELDTVLPGTCGTAQQAWWTVDGVGYTAAAAFGPEVSDADRQAVLDAFAGLGFRGSPPQMAASPVIGFVVAAGVQDDVAWRLEAGPSLTCQSLGACVVQLAVITTDAGGDEQAWPVTPPTSGSSITSASQPIGRATIAFGAAAADVVAVEIVTGDGTTVTPTSVPWPSTLEAFASPDAPVDGTIWWATVPDVDTVNAVPADGTPATPSGEVPSFAELRLDTQEIGGETVATMDVFGRTLEIRVGGPDGPALSMEGADPLSFSMINGSGTRHDLPGGTLVLWQSGTAADPVSVVVDGTGETIVGRWLPVTDNLGKEGRLWIVPLAGEGSGIERHGRGDLASAISWPTEREPAAGVVVFGGNNGDGVSWKVGYASPDCVVLAQVDGDPSIGQTDCLTPVSDAPLVAHAAGRERSLVALVIPSDAHSIYAGDIEDPRIFGQCGSLDRDPAWNGRSVCAIVVPNGQDIVLQPTTLDPGTQQETPLGDLFTVRVEDGRLFLTDGR